MDGNAQCTDRPGVTDTCDDAYVCVEHAEKSCRDLQEQAGVHDSAEEEPTVQERSVVVPPARMRHVKQEWLQIYTPIVEYGRLQLRFNIGARTIDLRTCPATPDPALIDRAAVFIQSVIDGFKPADAAAILKYRDVFTESFDITEIRRLKSAHLARALGRIIGRSGRTKESIENFARCKFILRDHRVFLLGCVDNIKIAKDAIGRLVQGSEPTSIFNRMRVIAAKVKDKYGSIQTIYEDLRQ